MHSMGVLRVLAATTLVGLVALGAACSSSSTDKAGQADPGFPKGLVYFYSPAKGTGPTLSATFTGCVAKGLSKEDQAEVAGKKSVSESLALSDAISIRVIRASEHCDHATTATGVQLRLLDPGESAFNLTATQKTCVNEKVTVALPKLDESKIQGSNSPELSKAIIGSFSGCVPVSQFIAGEVKGELSGTTAAQATCVGDDVAKTTNYDQMINSPDDANATVTSALTACGVKQ
jgi:hypothetical protein